MKKGKQQSSTATRQHNDTPHSKHFASDLKRSAPLTSSNISVPPSALCAVRCASSIVEFPISTLRIFGQNLPISGGGYFRLFPYSLIKKALKRINEEEEQPFIFYIHPWEIDPNQPRLNSVSFRSRFGHYINLNKTESKLKKLLTDFEFAPIRNVVIHFNSSINPMNHNILA